MASINQLPDLCLLHIFEHLKPFELLEMENVCERWSQLLASACKRRRVVRLASGQVLNLYQLDTLCERFAALGTLKLTVSYQSLCKLTTCLGKLGNLQHLQLKIYFHGVRRFSDEDELAGERFAHLPRLRSLRLINYATTHTSLHSKHLARIFGQVESLSIYQGHSCIDCGYLLKDDTELQHYLAYEPHQYYRCVRRLFRPWLMQCERLRQIESILHEYVPEPLEERHTRRWTRDQLLQA